jgi:DNA-binding CsgD family transcriptional regulator
MGRREGERAPASAGRPEPDEAMLRGRSTERAALAALIGDAQAFRSGVLVLRGPAGVGKSAILEDAVHHADGMQILRATGVESESELPFAALHQLLRPVLGHLTDLPAPQAKALGAAFGLDNAGGDIRFLVSVAVLGVLAEAAEHRPVLCLVDDAQWLDDASVNALLFAARRLEAEPVALILAVRDGDARRFTAPGIAELRIGNLDSVTAAELLAERAGVPIPVDISARLVRATAGNPLALVELAAALTPGQLSGRQSLPWPLPLTEGVEQAFLHRVRRLPAQVQRLLLVASADDSARLALVMDAAARLGVAPSALDAAERAELVRVRAGRLDFRHPLVRSAVYQGATTTERQDAHRALADALGPQADVDRRTWHRALATVEPDEAIVADLELTAVRARARGAFEAACTALERAAELTTTSDRRARRMADAGENAWLAGQMGRAAGLLHEARLITTDPVVGADIDHLRAWIEFSVGSPVTGRQLLVQAAGAVADTDPPRAVQMLVAAAEAAWVTSDGTAAAELRRLADRLPHGVESQDRFFTALLHGFVGLLHGEFGRPVRALVDAMQLAREMGRPDILTRAGHTAFYLGDDDAAYRLNLDTVARGRASGAVGDVVFALQRLTLAELLVGRWAAAETSASEGVRLCRETGQPGLATASLAWLAVLAALRGERDRLATLLTETGEMLRTHPLGVLQAQVHDALNWARGLDAAADGRSAAAHAFLSAMSHPAIAGMAAALDRIEAAAHAGRRDVALEWLAVLDAFASHTALPSAQARVAHCRALLAEGTLAEELFEEALTLHGRSSRPFERARTELAYGQLLRRARRRVAARAHLQAAIDKFDQLGAAPWADRARSELRAAGQTARKRNPSTVRQLTPQEIQVARFVATGMHTREVAAQLFLSHRTVDFHLRNVFTKLGISSRAELAHLPLD